jgi:hypothetical protein
MQTQAITRHDLESRIVKRTWEDESFRGEFLADPSATPDRYLQVSKETLPNIGIHQEQPGSSHIVLPAKMTNAGALSDTDLERVAGGTTPSIGLIISLVSAPVYIAASIAASVSAGASASAIVTVFEEGW